jgi:hypothetical protein
VPFECTRDVTPLADLSRLAREPNPVAARDDRCRHDDDPGLRQHRLRRRVADRGQGLSAPFDYPGYQITVPGGQTTPLSARAADALANTSGCSNSIGYTEVNP